MLSWATVQEKVSLSGKHCAALSSQQPDQNSTGSLLLSFVMIFVAHVVYNSSSNSNNINSS